jgi:nucleoid-associated protein YgaU
MRVLAAAGALLATLLVEAVASSEPDRRTHEVVPGETLWTIAETTIGDPTLWPALYRANRDQIKDPARVYPGQKLTIPASGPSAVRELRREALDLTPR